MTVSGNKFLKKVEKSNRIRLYSIFMIVLIIASVSFLAIGISEPTAKARSRPVNHAPKVNITSPSDGAKVSGIVDINGTASDDVAVKWVNVVINTVHYNATDTSGNSTWYTWRFSLNTSKYSNGWLNVAAYAHDGKLAEDIHIEIQVNNSISENERPNIWIGTSANNTEVNGTITIKGHANDDVKVRLVDFEIDSKEYQATDTSGNSSWWSWKLVFDTTKLENGEYWFTSWAWDDEDLGGHDKILLIINNTENHWPYCNITHPKNEATVSGVIIIKGHAWDNDGNVTSVIVIINGTQYNATDTSGNGSWYTWSLKYNTTILKDGEYKVKIIAKDNGGKLGDEASWIVVKNTKENAEPHVTITHPKNEATVKGIINIKGRAWDTDGNITIVQIRIAEKWYNATDTSGNSTWYYWSLNFNTSILKDDEYKVTALAKDNGGKLTDAHSWIIIKNTPAPKENHWPYCNITHPKNEATVKGMITIKGHAWDIDGNVTSVIVIINGTHHNAIDTSGNCSWYTWSLKYNTTILNDGEYKVKIIAKDNGGKLGDEASWIVVKNNVEKENQAPFIEIIHPKKDAKVSGVITIKGKAWDNDGNVTKVKVRINEVWYEPNDDSSNKSWYQWSLDFNTTSLKNGEYKITAAAYDSKLWVDTHIWVDIKNKLATVQILLPTSNQNLSGEVNISGKAWGPRAIDYVKVKIGESEFNATDTSGNGTWYTWKFIWNASGYENGSYKITAYVSDGVNIDDTHVEVNVNNTPMSKAEDKPERKQRNPLPGFEFPFLVVAVVAVVMTFFRNGWRNRRTKQI